MSREFTNQLLIEECENFPLNTFLKSDGSINTRKINKLHPDFRQDAKDLIFISKALKIHGYFFGYEEAEYHTMSQQVKIFCPDCQEYFMQLARVHLTGSGCPNCKGKMVIRKTEVGDFNVPRMYHQWVILGDEITFYTSKGFKHKISIARALVS